MKTKGFKWNKNKMKPRNCPPGTKYRILRLDNKPMKKVLTPIEYKKLPNNEQHNWRPLYKRYRRVRVRNYCEECGQFTGYTYDRRGIGSPIKYIEREVFEAMIHRNFIPKILDNILCDNPLFRVKNE